MKKISLLVLLCMLCSMILALTSCTLGAQHTHAHGTDWTMDATNHYHLCSCGDKKDTAAHADADNDGACDACSAIMANNHVYASAWSSDADNHWHAPLCGHDVEVADKAAHTFNAIGDCTVCGYTDIEAEVDVSDLTKALAAAKLAQSKVIFGTLTHSYGALTYSYGDNYLYVKDTNTGYELYVTKGADDKYDTVCIDPNNFEAPVSVTEDVDAENYAGPVFNLYNAIGQDVNVYGAIDLIDYFFNTLPAASEAEFTFGAAGDLNGSMYVFSYVAPLTINETTADYTITGLVTLNAGYSINTVSISIMDADYNTHYTIGYAQSEDLSLVLTPELAVPTELVVKDAEGNALVFTEGTAPVINATAKTYELSLDVLPATALMGIYGQIGVVVKDAEGNDVTYLDPAEGGVYAYLNTDTNIITVPFEVAGEYTLEITAKETVYSVPFNVTYGTPDEITPMVGEELSAWWGGTYYSFSGIDENTVNAYVGHSVIFGAGVPEGCEGNKFTVSVTGDNASSATVSEAITGIDYEENEVVVYSFSASATGTYTVVVTSTVDETVKAEVSVVVTEAPAMKDFAVGKYTFEETNNFGETTSVIVNFYPTNDTKGVLVVDRTLSMPGWDTENTVYTYTYYITAEGAFVCTFNAGTLITPDGPVADEYYSSALVAISSNFVVSYDGNTLTKASETADTYAGVTPMPEAPDAPADEEPSLPELPKKPNNLTVSENGTTVYTATLGDDGTFALVIDNYTASADYTITVDGATIALNYPGLTDTDASDSIVTIIGCTEYYPEFAITGTAGATITVTVAVSNVVPV